MNEDWVIPYWRAGLVAALALGWVTAMQASTGHERCAQPLQSAKLSLRDQPAVTSFRSTNPDFASDFDLAAAEERPVCAARSHDSAQREERKALARSVKPTSAVSFSPNASHTIAIAIAIAQAPLGAP